ncbi:hypothetical protein Mal4_32500 [Maioricimonas rarisocia]|uniref:DUF1598 domain-containing protein n=1 Tax=Maioricimonas rarisocia TaxID=2528026 RepID=A0A517Z8W0_9PLAN|nr:DUF1598 domain-containing protein [Maioricimonas rarisocia]QDU38918.1 hypothetical protein Mal4_32500 [Maioricimonas rarisocia]
MHQRVSVSETTSARRGQVAPLLVGAACFAALLVGLAIFQSSPEVEAPAVAIGEREIVTEQVVATTPAVETTATAPTETGQPVAPIAATPAEQRQQQVAGHVDAGEFQQAVDVALTATSAEERSALLRRVARAQMQMGAFDAARATIRRIPDSEQRIAEQVETSRQELLAGGSGADFESLIDLIQNETEGPWLDVDGIGGTITEFESGVRVDPTGLLYQVNRRELSGKLAALGLRARKADLNEDMARPSALRMVSLTRLEQAVAERLENGQPVVESMRQLAGLSQIQYVFVYPEDGEVVIAGPAEGWAYNELGMPVGVHSGQPTLQLDDLVTVLRTFAPGGQQIFGCSIDPRPEGLKELQEFVAASQANGPLSSGQVRSWAEQLGQKLGRQDITVYGVPTDSRVARVLVEADYRMKLIGLGKGDQAADIPSYFDLLGQNPEYVSGGMDALRWWMTMQYDSVLHSDDHNAFEIQGSSVLCQSENQFLTAQGQRVETGKSEPMNQLFASRFTERFDQLAQEDPIFADMQGIFDLALVAALIRHERIDDRLDWNLGAFGINGQYQPARYAAPTEVDTAVNHRVYRGTEVVVQVAGGVRADLLSVLNDAQKWQSAPRLGQTAESSRPANLPEGRWWWDVTAN